MIELQGIIAKEKLKVTNKTMKKSTKVDNAKMKVCFLLATLNYN